MSRVMLFPSTCGMVGLGPSQHEDLQSPGERKVEPIRYCYGTLVSSYYVLIN